MSCLNQAIQDFEQIVEAFQQELPTQIVQNNILILIENLKNLNIPDVIEWIIIGQDINSNVEIDGNNATLPDNTIILKLGTQTPLYFLAEDEVLDTVTNNIYFIGSELKNVTSI